MKKKATSGEIRYFNDCFELPNQGLRAYFDRVVKGQPEVYDTPFARGESTQVLLSKWMAKLESIGDKWPTLLEFEDDLSKKVGPMSIMKPLSERMNDIESYYEGILLPSKPISRRAVSAVIDEWSGIRGLRPRSQSNTVRLMKMSTNSGSPFFTKRKTVLGKTLPVYLSVWSDDNQVYQSLNNGHATYMAAAVLGWRGQEGGEDESMVKQRVVWMMALAVNIGELTVYQPLIEAAQKQLLVPAWVSNDEVDKRITALFDSKGADDLVVCTDFTKFDQHFNEDLQYAVETVLRALMTASHESLGWLRDVFPIKYVIPLAYDWEKIRFGKHGMASGSGGTNVDETIAHRALQHEAALTHHAKLNPNSQCLGDDGILSYPGITVEDVVETYTKHGLEMNLDKQYASTQDCTYLRRWHHKDYRVNGICVGVYSTCRALGRLRYLERFQDPEWWGPKAVALRQLSIIENCKWHPLREEFAQFCMARDKYRLGIDIPNFLDNIRHEAEEINEHMHDFLGYTKTLQSRDPVGGIQDWWIVNYLKSQR
jgi:hypothetical protein